MLKGVLFSLSASILFGCMYYLSTFLEPLSGLSIFGFRMVVTIPFLFIALLIFKKQKEFLAFLAKLKEEPLLIPIILITSAIVGGEMWLFLSAPNSGKAIEVSMGYLILPIAMTAFGKLVYKETLSLFKWLAVAFAIIGVASNLYLAGHFSWEGIFVFTGYPIYFYLRKKYGLSHLHSFVLEILFLIPISIYYISQTDMQYIESQNEQIYYLIALLGLVSGSALICYTMASSILPFNLLGLLGYVEPCVMLIFAFIMGEKLSQDAYILMSCLFIAIILLVLDGLMIIRKQKRKVHFVLS